MNNFDILFSQCLCCKDKSNFQSKVNDANRIQQYIDKKVNHLTQQTKKNSEYYNLERKLQFAPTNAIHFMCGQCSKVNMYDLQYAEDKLKKSILSAILKLKYLISIHDIHSAMDIKHDILYVLRGHYPVYYNILDDTIIIK